MNYETKTTVITKVKHELHVNFDDVASTFGGTIDPDDLKDIRVEESDSGGSYHKGEDGYFKLKVTLKNYTLVDHYECVDMGARNPPDDQMGEKFIELMRDKYPEKNIQSDARFWWSPTHHKNEGKAPHYRMGTISWTPKTSS